MKILIGESGYRTALDGLNGYGHAETPYGYTVSLAVAGEEDFFELVTELTEAEANEFLQHLDRFVLGKNDLWDVFDATAVLETIRGGAS